MVSEEIIMSVARVSASLASIFGIIILVMTIIAIKRFSPGSFRSSVMTSALFLLIVVLGVSAMTIYHFSEGTYYESMGDSTNNMWYALMFFALIFSCWESWRYGLFGKSISDIPAHKSKK